MPNTLLDTRNEQLPITELFDKYAPAVYGRILTVVKNKDVADKILERVFINMAKKRGENKSRISDFMTLMNESRTSTYHIIKSIKLYNAFSCASAESSCAK